MRMGEFLILLVLIIGFIIVVNNMTRSIDTLIVYDHENRDLSNCEFLGFTFPDDRSIFRCEDGKLYSIQF